MKSITIPHEELSYLHNLARSIDLNIRDGNQYQAGYCVSTLISRIEWLCTKPPEEEEAGE